MAGVPARKRHIDVAYEGNAAGPSTPTLERSGAGASVEKPAAAPEILPLSEVGVLPEPADNCAILRRQILAGTKVRLLDGTVVTVGFTVLEGHRIAAAPIASGSYLLSWGLPFGAALRDLAAGEYVCNESMLSALRLRHIEGLPPHGNFEDVILPHSVDEASFAPVEQVPLLPKDLRGTFAGYDRRDAQGGVGTRNFVAIVPTSALSSPLARRLADALRPAAKGLHDCDGVVALAHTEAALEATEPRPKNWDLLLRTLAGFVSHPNVAAALVVGYRGELLSPAVLQAYMEAEGRPMPKWCRFLTLDGAGFAADLDLAREVVLPWLPEVNSCRRTPQPLSQLRVALQCGGSDAFSGVSGNAASGWAAKMLIEHGGAAVLAETDELIGAESYILARVRDCKTATNFLHFVDRFKERFTWHGQNAESNPSGGNKLRGLYNIALKSIGAAKKKHADVSLDGVLEYGERLAEGERGYFFMDSPGNDLESIAGQVASGCNAIFFITGNGSITNFPFVPTVKIITTTERYRLLERDMDFNAGRFQDEGVPMATLGAELFDRLVRVSSGEQTAGERAGHSQVSIWREWAQDCMPDDPAKLAIGECDGVPLRLSLACDLHVKAASDLLRAVPPALRVRVGLVLPTSLCSGEVARMAAESLERCREGSGVEPSGFAGVLDKFVALPHTEGCGAGYANDGERIFSRVVLGHLTHPNVSMALMLEHGCEKTHNAWMKDELSRRDVDTQRFGYASVQLDGGMDKVTAKVHDWFANEAQRRSDIAPALVPLAHQPLALLSQTGEASTAATCLAVALLRAFVAAEGTVVVPSTFRLARTATFADELCGSTVGVEPTLAFAQPVEKRGAHVMHVPDGVVSKVELISGLVAAGAAIVLVITDGSPATAVPVVGHPFVPVLHITVEEHLLEPVSSTPVLPSSAGGKGYDLRLTTYVGEELRARDWRWLRAVVDLIAGAASRTFKPVAAEVVGFQVARGPTGVST